jgi:hypothetical protein
MENSHSTPKQQNESWIENSHSTQKQQNESWMENSHSTPKQQNESWMEFSLHSRLVRYVHHRDIYYTRG